MANFKVGDRVKRIADPLTSAYAYASETSMPLGATGTVVGFGLGEHVKVEPDSGDMPWHCLPRTLAPLTPPAEDTWAADKVRELVKPKPMDAEREQLETVKLG